VRANDHILWTAIALSLLANTVLLGGAHMASHSFEHWALRVALASN
jgi:hypothetical protein